MGLGEKPIGNTGCELPVKICGGGIFQGGKGRNVYHRHGDLH